ncbi:sensor histidine kinase [Tenuifilum thalassicum]|nr:sensor histidine kinase [Tenuifilum thalassicum]
MKIQHQAAMIDFRAFNSNKFFWFSIDLKNRLFEDISPSLFTLTGKDINSLNEMLFNKNNNLISDDINLILDFIKDCEEDTSIEIPYPIRVFTAKQELRWVELSLQVKVTETREPYKLIGMGWDVSSFLSFNEKLVTDLKKHKEELSQSLYFNKEILKAKEKERRKIAFEIHDELGQLLSALKLEQTMLLQRVRTPSTKESLKGMLAMTGECINTVRRLSSELHPSIIDHLGLFPAVEWLVNNFTKRVNANIKLTLPQQKSFTFSSTDKIFIFRVVQEALNNIMKHAQAKNVSISVLPFKQSLKLIISDDGVGFDTTQKKKKHSLGLLGMRERVNAMGGQIEIVSEPLKGTTISCTIPLR